MAGWFLGPKAENAGIEREILLRVFEDYVRWRRECYPQDAPLIDQAMQHGAAGFHQRLTEAVDMMREGLRRDFPSALLERASIDPADYRLHGLFILRATLMTPYLTMAAEAGKQSHLDEFFERLDENTLAVLRELRQPTQLRETADSKQSPSPVDR